MKNGDDLPCGSWLLDAVLKPFHQDLRSRFVGGDAAICCC